MNDIERKKLAMYESIVSYLLENRDILSTVRGFSWSLTKLRRVIDEIELKEKEISSQTLEKTIQTSKAREELILKLTPMVTSMFTYSKQIGDVYLKEKSRCTQSFLVRLRDSELIDKSNALRQLAGRHIDGLKGFGITKNFLNELEINIEQFKKSLENKITSFISSDAVESLRKLFEYADRILMEQMDKFVEQLDEEYEEFYEDYLLIRAMENTEEIEDGLEIEEIEV